MNIPHFTTRFARSSQGCDTLAHVTLSKIRFVHLQAQLLMLVQYVQEGILDILADPSSAPDQLGEVNVIAEETPPALFKVRVCE